MLKLPILNVCSPISNLDYQSDQKEHSVINNECRERQRGRERDLPNCDRHCIYYLISRLNVKIYCRCVRGLSKHVEYCILQYVTIHFSCIITKASVMDVFSVSFR